MKINTSSYRSHILLATVTLVFPLLGVVHPSLPMQAADNPDISSIVSAFTAGEAEFRTAFNNYGYRSELAIQSVKNGSVTGEFRRTTQIVLGKNGKLEEKIISLPRPSLTDVGITREDLEVLSSGYQFALEAANASKYKFTYAGKERVDNIDLFAFDIEPKSISSKERLFRGRVWVSVRDQRIVKTRGRAVQKGNQSFALMEVYRSAVEGRYLFPSLGFADEEIVFPHGNSVRVRIEVRYTDYVKLK